MSTLYDVLRKLPVARTVAKNDVSEREEAKILISHLRDKSVCLFDRGYISYDLLSYIEEELRDLTEEYSGYYVMRCPAYSTFEVLMEFMRSSKEDDIVWIKAPKRHIKEHGTANTKSIKVRAIKYVMNDGTAALLVTNLFDQTVYTREDIIDLYFKRWAIEGGYRDEKASLEIEKLHSKTINGVLQELYAVMIMSVIARVLMALSEGDRGKELQFKNTVIALAKEAALLTPDAPQKAVEIFNELIEEISKVHLLSSERKKTISTTTYKKVKEKWCNGAMRYA
ncbi:MAG: IS4 family transposase [Nitrospirae bacterium]|nr:IS4 family transposase [Nitrospirota bacterium]